MSYFHKIGYYNILFRVGNLANEGEALSIISVRTLFYY